MKWRAGTGCWVYSSPLWLYTSPSCCISQLVPSGIPQLFCTAILLWTSLWQCTAVSVTVLVVVADMLVTVVVLLALCHATHAALPSNVFAACPATYWLGMWRYFKCYIVSVVCGLYICNTGTKGVLWIRHSYYAWAIIGCLLTCRVQRWHSKLQSKPQEIGNDGLIAPLLPHNEPWCASEVGMATTHSKKEWTQKLALNLFGSNMLHVCGKLMQDGTSSTHMYTLCFETHESNHDYVSKLEH